MEVYTAIINPDTMAVTELTRLTDDNYYDSMPSCAYDSESGDRMVFYVKSGKTTGTPEELTNPYTNDCAVMYMLYSKDDSRWLFDKYFNEELAPEDHAEMIRDWKGQRFLSSPLPELGIDVPNVTDFTVTTYNGLAVYAYTVDRDSSNDTDGDKDIFVQLYDFRDHKTYHPVRITNDSVSDTMPQLIRVMNTQDQDAHTKLFWFRDSKVISYIDVSKLIREGINDDGTIKEDDPSEGGFEFSYSSVSVKGDPNGSLSMADFKVTEDPSGNLYVIWTEGVSDEDGENRCQEVYATALIGTTDDLAADADLTDEQLSARGGAPPSRK